MSQQASKIEQVLQGREGPNSALEFLGCTGIPKWPAEEHKQLQAICTLPLQTGPHHNEAAQSITTFCCGHLFGHL